MPLDISLCDPTEAEILVLFRAFRIFSPLTDWYWPFTELTLAAKDTGVGVSASFQEVNIRISARFTGNWNGDKIGGLAGR